MFEIRIKKVALYVSMKHVPSKMSKTILTCSNAFQWNFFFMFCNSAIESWCFWQICYCTILLARYFLEVLEKKRPYLGIKKVCNVYETVCSPSTKYVRLTKYCLIKCQDFSLSYQNRAVGSFENPERPIVIDCLSLLLFVHYGCKIWWGNCIRLRGRKMCYKNSKIAVSCTKYAAFRHYLRQL